MNRYTQDFFAYFGGKQVYKATGGYLTKQEGHAQAKQIYGQLAKTGSYGHLVVCIVSKYPTECWDGQTFGAQPPPPEPKAPPAPTTRPLPQNTQVLPKPTTVGPITAVLPGFSRPPRSTLRGVQWVGDVRASGRPTTPACPPGFYFSSRYHSCVPGGKSGDTSLHGLGEDLSFTVTKVEEINEAKTDLALWGNAYPTLHPAAPSYKGDITAPPWSQVDAKMLIAFADWWNADLKHVSKLSTTGVLDQWHLFSLRAFVASGAGKSSPYNAPGGQTSPGQPTGCPPGQQLVDGKCVAVLVLPPGSPGAPAPATPGGKVRVPGGVVVPGGTAPATKPPVEEKKTPWGWIIGGVALAGVAGLAIWSGARGVGAGIGEAGAKENPDRLYPRAPRTGPLPGTYRMRVYVGPVNAKEIGGRLGAQAGVEHVYVDVPADGAYAAKLAVQDLFTGHGLFKPPVADIRVWAHEKSHVWDPEPRANNPAPSKNIYWKDIGPGDRVELKGHVYVVTKPSGKRAVAFWEGREAHEAQRWLESRRKS